MSIKKISYYDLKHVPAAALMKQHKINTAQFEQAVRDHCKGASTSEMKSFYNEIYSKKESK